jgi:hypothetical protein
LAKIDLHPDVPLNIVELDRAEFALAASYFERGWLIVLKNFRIKADIDFLSTVTLPADMLKKHGKVVLTRPEHAAFDGNRTATWDTFRNQVFAAKPEDFSKFYNEVFTVNDELHSIASALFPKYSFQKKRVTWKFERIDGQNLHIDNIQGTERHAQLRVFVNLASSTRRWTTAEHISVYANRYFEAANLAEVAGDPVKFNHRLSGFAFGNSAQKVSDARHEIEFEPGEVWILNSAVTAHQVRYGRLLALNCLEFPYHDYENPKLALPNVIRDLADSRAARTKDPMEKRGSEPLANAE